MANCMTLCFQLTHLYLFKLSNMISVQSHLFTLSSMQRCCVPAGSEIAGPSCDEHFGTLWPALTTESEPTVAVAAP